MLNIILFLSCFLIIFILIFFLSLTYSLSGWKYCLRWPNISRLSCFASVGFVCQVNVYVPQPWTWSCTGQLWIFVMSFVGDSCNGQSLAASLYSNHQSQSAVFCLRGVRRNMSRVIMWLKTSPFLGMLLSHYYWVISWLPNITNLTQSVMSMWVWIVRL